MIPDAEARPGLAPVPEVADPRHAIGDTRAVLRDAGLRVTAPRQAVLGVLATHPHSTADAVAGAVRARLGSVSTQAVYDVLAACVDAGLVRRIEPAGSAARYETRTGDNHHHVVCRACGATADVDCVVGERPCLSPSDDSGFLIEAAEVVFWGLCPGCRVRASQSNADAIGAGPTPLTVLRDSHHR